VLTPEKLKAIHNTSLEMLERTGLYVELPKAREMFRGAGAKVDGDKVKVPSFLIDNALSTVPHTIVFGNRDGQRNIELVGNRSYYRAQSDMRMIIDPYTGATRNFVSKDYEMTCKVIDACTNIHAGGSVGNAHDYPPEVRQQASFRHSVLYTNKPFMFSPLDAQQLADVYEMAAAIAGGYDQLRAAPFAIPTCEPTSPLGFIKEAVEVLLLAARENMPVVWYPMLSPGATAPCTPASTLAMGNAEILAGLVLHQLERPGAPFIYGMMPSMMDMRSTQWAYGSPDFGLQLAAATDLAHSYGLPMYGTAGCTDSLAVDEQATGEALMLLLMGQLSGANMIHDVGVLAGAALISPEMILLCDELIQMTDHSTRQIDTSPNELMLDLIDEVGPQGNYLALDHTLANFRRFWHSGLFLRNRLTGSEEDAIEPFSVRLNQRTRDIIENQESEPLSPEILRELDSLEKKWMARVVA
jgi:trimethylamine---corrinoid protein Co-methyltransferase